MISEKRAFFRVFGTILILFGVVVFLNSFSNITGFAVVEKTPDGVGGSILGIALIVGGALLFVMSGERKRTKNLASIVGEHEMDEEEERTAHEVAHSALSAIRLRDQLRKERELHGEEPSRKVYEQFERKYGPPPPKDQEEKWVTLYHAFPKGEFRRPPGKFLDKKRIRGGGFYMTDKPEAAQEELKTLSPLSDISILKINIARSAIDDLKIEGVYNDLGRAYRIKKSMVDFANKLYEAGYIKLGRGR